MSQPAQNVEENSQNPDENDEKTALKLKLIEDINGQRLIPKEYKGLLIQSIDLPDRMEKVEAVVIKMSEYLDKIQPALRLSEQIEAMEKARQQTPAPPTQGGNVSPPIGGNAFDIIRLASQFMGGSSEVSDLDRQLMDSMKQRMINQMTKDPNESAYDALSRFADVLNKGIQIGARSKMSPKDLQLVTSAAKEA